MSMLIALTCLIVFNLVIWFKTDAFIEYGSLIGLSRYLKVKEYQAKKIVEPYFLTYPQFLRITHNTFFNRLISCPICLSVWMAIVFCILGSCIYLLPLLCVSSWFVYYLLTLLIDHTK
jgi:hypothetical protein